jgi:hypothetical protein
MNFKEFFYKSRTLLEFKAQEFYDFYTLAAIQKMPNIHGELSTQRTEYDKEIEDKIIDKGNKVIDEIIDDISLVLLKRHMPIKKFLIQLKEKYPETLNKIPKERQIRTGFNSNNWGENKFFDIWRNFTDKDKDNIIEAALPLYKSGVFPSWKATLELVKKTKEQMPILNVNQIVYKVNELTQMVHANGSLLEYLPSEFDHALQTRDNASTAYLASIASPSVKELIRSAGVGYLGKPEEPKYLDLIKTAMNRAIKGKKFFEDSYFLFEETIQNSPETESMKGTLVIPSSSFNVFIEPHHRWDAYTEQKRYFKYFSINVKNSLEIQKEMEIKEKELKDNNNDSRIWKPQFQQWVDQVLMKRSPRNNDFYPTKIYYIVKENNVNLLDDIRIDFLMSHQKKDGKQFKGVNISYTGIKNQFFNLFTKNVIKPEVKSLYQSVTSVNYNGPNTEYKIGIVTFAERKIIPDMIESLLNTHNLISKNISS